MVGDIGLLFNPGIFHGLKKILSSPKALTLGCPFKQVVLTQGRV